MQQPQETITTVDDTLLYAPRSRAAAMGASMQSDTNNALNSFTSTTQSPQFYTTKYKHNTPTAAVEHSSSDTQDESSEWRIKERLKTVSVALVVCLNIGVDPPDLVKTDPCAKLECWMDPAAQPPQKSLESIGKQLQTQYELWQPRARYKQALDPTAEDLKKLCCALRRNAKDERILLHYNGHGVPRPTASGELWVFNKNYTQYIPVSIYDIQTWMGAPSILVYDCSGAGHLMSSFIKFSQQRDVDAANFNAVSPSDNAVPPYVSHKHCIQLAACDADQVLPMHPDLPADLFTACLTTPIEIALKWFVMQNQLLLTHVTPEMVTKLPGKLNDRRTPLGELNWIFTAITDTIAWNCLPRPMFQRLFRQDLLLAAIFRNFLLADRVLRSYQCTPLSSPSLPQMSQHPLWQAWDLAAETCLSQLPALIDEQNPQEYQNSSFFSEQLTAFEVWLSKGQVHRKRPSEQLPIVLQVLLSQAHRLRALLLLGKFLDLGAWAVFQALAVGIFPYVLKLLQSPAVELKLILSFIWARIMAVDGSCQADLLKDNGYMYFVSILLGATNLDAVVTDSANMSELYAMCAFVLSVFAHDFPAGQEALLQANVMTACVGHLSDADPLLRQWSTICLGELWCKMTAAKIQAISEGIHEKLYLLLTDDVPDVRAAALFAIGRLFCSSSELAESLNDQIDLAQENIGLTLLVCTGDASPTVRTELVIALSGFFAAHQSKFITASYEYLEEEKQRSAPHTVSSVSQMNRLSSRTFSSSLAHHSFYSCMWKVLLNSSMDPASENVGKLARIVVDIINYQMALKHKDLYGVSNLPQDSSKTLPAGSSSAISTVASRLTRDQVSGSFKTLSESAADNLSLSLGVSSTVSKIARQSSLKRISGAHSIQPLSSMPGRSQNRLTSGARPKSVVSSTEKLFYRPASSASLSRASKPTAAKDVSTILPFSSTFFEKSFEFFKDPRLKPNDDELPGGRIYVHKEWQRRRNITVLKEAQAAQTNAITRPESIVSGVIDSQMAMTTQLAYHPFLDHLVVVDNKNHIGVWNWAENTCLTRFSNGNKNNSRVSALKFINDRDGSFLFTGSDDGIVRLYKNYEDASQRKIVSSWRSLSEIFPDDTGSGLVMDWQQPSGSLIVSGDVKHIRIWSAEKELCVADIPTKSPTCITSLTSDKLLGHVIIAGCGDGAIRLYDRRMSPKDAMVMCFHEHKSWVVGVHLQTGSSRKLASACNDGEVKFWDSRFKSSVLSIEADTTGRVSSMALHDYAPMFAVGSESQFVKVYNCNGSLMSHTRHHDGFLGQRLAPVNTLAFHPHRIMLAAGGQDQLIYTATWQ